MIQLDKDSIPNKRSGFFRRRRPKIGGRIRQRAKSRRLRRMSRPVRFPRIRKVVNFFVNRLKLGAVFSFIFRSIVVFLRSLWFRMVGVYVITLLILLSIILNQVSTYSWSALSRIESEFPESQQMEEVIPNPPGTDLDLPPSVAFEPGSEIISIEIDPDGLGPIIASEIIEPAPPVSSHTRAFEATRGLYYNLQDEINVIFVSTTFFVLIFGTLIYWQVSRPLVKIRKASNAISRGDHSVRVKVRSKNELGRVATAFNEMAEEIEKQDQMRKRMVADVAHELRTPLTVMKSNLEAMLDGILEPSPDELTELHDEVGRLNRMIEDLRLLSLADAGELPIIKQPVDVRQLLGTIATRYTSLAESNNIKLAFDDGPQPLMVMADSDKLQQAIRNLLENALHYTPHGGRVRVTAVEDKSFAKISIIDTGSGIRPEEIEQLFDRFWRGDRSRNRHSGGSGLGLSIVEQIAELHGGSVNVVSPDGAGAIFTIKLPISSAAAKSDQAQRSWIRSAPAG